MGSGGTGVQVGLGEVECVSPWVDIDSGKDRMSIIKVTKVTMEEVNIVVWFSEICESM